MKKFVFIIVVLGYSIFGISQNSNHPFFKEIQNFKKLDSLNFPAKHSILFVGSSSFTKWTNVQNCFPTYPIINRGFGGSTLQDVIYYANEIIIPYQPKQIIIYCGENDFASSDSITKNIVVNRFKYLFKIIRKKYPHIPIAYISMKPSPSRFNLMPQFSKANKAIKHFLKFKKYTNFIDVYHAMLDKFGNPIADIFINDRLHMNDKGYAIWQKIIKPYLKK